MIFFLALMLAQDAPKATTAQKEVAKDPTKEASTSKEAPAKKEPSKDTPAKEIPKPPPQDFRNQADRIRAQMKESLDKQRASVQSQITAIRVNMPQGNTMINSNFPCEPIAAPKMDKMITEAATKEHVEPALIREVARQESAFYPCAVSPKGAVGLMQLMPETQTTFAVRNPTDPQESISAGAKFLKQLLDRYQGDLSLALSAYNAGPTRVDQLQSVPQIPETMDYVATILGRLNNTSQTKIGNFTQPIPPALPQ